MPTKYRNRRSSQLKNIKGGCWRGYERVPGTIEFSKGSCRKIGSAAPKYRRRKLRGGSLRRSKSRRRRRSKSCTPGANKKFATLVNNKCIRFGDPNMTIKKNKPGRKRSFCARHRCKLKRDPQTPGYQSCRKWNCSTGA